MRQTWAWLLAAVGAASLAVLGVSAALRGPEELSWAAGTGSFVLAAAAMALAWPRRTFSVPTPAPSPVSASTRADNRIGDNHGTSIQAGAIHGPVTVTHPPTTPAPGWVDTALPVQQWEPSALGAHDALPGSGDAGLPPYVARDVDGELDRCLAAVARALRGGMVLVSGASTAGKTRALAAALGRTLPGRMLVSPPEGADLRPLPAWLRAQGDRAPQGWVVWLDDLDRHLSASGLTPALVTELGHAGAVMAATIRTNRLRALRPSATDHASAMEGVGYAVLRPPPVVVERRWTPPERERARASGEARLVRAAADGRFGVAEQLAAGPRLQQEWIEGLDSHPRGYALVAAAVGLASVGVSSALPREQIQAVHEAYLPGPPPLPEDADQAWAWATRPRSGLAGLLVPVDHEGHRWRAFDYLTLQDPLPEGVWKAALDTATDQDRFTIGVTAYHAGRVDIAETAWRALAARAHTLAMCNLGVLLQETGRLEEAESWWRQAADQGHTDAMNNLGNLLVEADRGAEAEGWYRQAAEQGDINAMRNLGVLLDGAAQRAEAEEWWRRAREMESSG